MGDLRYPTWRAASSPRFSTPSHPEDALEFERAFDVGWKIRVRSIRPRDQEEKRERQGERDRPGQHAGGKWRSR